MNDAPVTAERSERFVSIVMVIRNAGGAVEPVMRQCHALLAARYSDFELVCFDNGSTDDTAARVRSLLQKIPGIRLVTLAATVPTEVAYAAGVENAIGDFIVLLDPLHDPPEMIPGAVERCRAGADVVIGVAQGPPPPAPERTARAVTQALLRPTMGQLPERGGSVFHVLSRRAANAATRTSRFRHQFWIRLTTVGYSTELLPYQPRHPGGQSPGRGIFRAYEENMGLLVFNTTWPLRLMGAVGMGGSLLAVLISLYVLAVNLVKGDVVAGWTTMTLFNSSLFFLLFLILAFSAEYLARMLQQLGEPQEYHVVAEQHSSVMADETRHNVLTDSNARQDNAVQTGRDR